MNFKKILLLTCFLTPIFGACKKEIADIVVTPTKTNTTINGKLVVYPSPGDLSKVERLNQSNDYIVEVRKTGEISYQPCFVYKTDNYWIDTYFGGKPKPQTSASFTSFAFEKT
jgi:hypothetical protein